MLSGGASLGAVQVGMLQALAGAGIRPDFLVGASVGAFNAAWVAGHATDHDFSGLEQVWRRLRLVNVFPPDPRIATAAILGRSPYLFAARGLQDLIRHHVPFESLEQAEIPLHVVATDVITGEELLLSKGSAHQALLATSAIPGILPSVHVGGRDLMDGGVANNTPLRHAIDLDATLIYVLSTGYACALSEAPKSVLGMALHALGLMVQQRLATDVERYEGFVEIHVLPTPCPLSVSPADFSHAAELISRGRELTRRWLRKPRRRRHQADLLSIHTHESEKTAIAGA